MKIEVILCVSTALMFVSCNGSKQADTQSGDSNSNLPVSEEQLCKDWARAYQEDWAFEPENVPIPETYLPYDIDGDGRPEILVKAPYNTGLFAYDKEGQVSFSYVNYDNYDELGVGPGWFVTLHDDHMGESRHWTFDYCRVKEGKYESIGTYSIERVGVTEDGEYEEEVVDGTGDQRPSGEEYTMYYDLEGWIPFSQQAIDAMRQSLGSATPAPEASAVTEAPTEKPKTIAGEIVLAGGTRCRVDIKHRDSSLLYGWTTYYRKNGDSSTIPFFGNAYHDDQMGEDYYELHEYNAKGKCCGHLSLSYNQGEFVSGKWQLRDRQLTIDSYQPATYNTQVEPVLAAPSTSEELGNKLLPCSREQINDLVHKTLPKHRGPNYLLLYDVNKDGTFEVVVQTSCDGRTCHSLLWVQDGEPRLLYSGTSYSVTLFLAPYIVLRLANAEGERSYDIYEWQNGEPEKVSLPDGEREFIIDNAYMPEALGEWF